METRRSSLETPPVSSEHLQEIKDALNISAAPISQSINLLQPDILPNLRPPLCRSLSTLEVLFQPLSTVDHEPQWSSMPRWDLTSDSKRLIQMPETSWLQRSRGIRPGTSAHPRCQETSVCHAILCGINSQLLVVVVARYEFVLLVTAMTRFHEL
jgi:hypothetical protein